VLSLEQTRHLRVYGLSREVFPDLNGSTKSARLVVTYVGWHTNTYTGVVSNCAFDIIKIKI